MSSQPVPHYKGSSALFEEYGNVQHATDDVPAGAPNSTAHLGHVSTGWGVFPLNESNQF